METATQDQTPPDLSILLITLFKGVLYRERDEKLWSALINLQPRVRDYLGVLNLELALDEAEGYAFLKARGGDPDEETAKLPRLIARRQLSFPVSLMLALLRKKLAEFDASGGDTRLILSLDQIVEMVRIFLPENSNEARFVDSIETTINRVIELGFLQKLKATSSHEAASYEVKRILKAFVDAQWLSEFDQQLASYQQFLNRSNDNAEVNL